MRCWPRAGGLPDACAALFPLLLLALLVGLAAPLLACVLVHVGQAPGLQALEVSQSIAASGPLGPLGTVHQVSTPASEPAP